MSRKIRSNRQTGRQSGRHVSHSEVRFVDRIYASNSYRPDTGIYLGISIKFVHGIRRSFPFSRVSLTVFGNIWFVCALYNHTVWVVGGVMLTMVMIPGYWPDSAVLWEIHHRETGRV